MQPTENVNSTPHTSHFLVFACTCVIICHTTLLQVFVRVISSMRHALECLISFRPSLWTLDLSLTSSISSSRTFFLLFLLPCGSCRSKIPCALGQLKSPTLWPITSSHINCSCGRKLKYKRSPKTTQKLIATYSILVFHLEELQSRTTARPIWTTDHVRQGEGYAQESKAVKARRTSNDSRNLVCTRRLPKVIG